MKRQKREVRAQDFLNFRLTVGAQATPISKGYQQSDIQQRFDTLIISNDSTNARSVFLGSQNVIATSGGTKSNGLELRVGKMYAFAIENERPLYEVEGPLIDQFCGMEEMIPLIAWDISSLYLIAASNTDIAVMLFRNMNS